MYKESIIHTQIPLSFSWNIEHNIKLENATSHSYQRDSIFSEHKSQLNFNIE